MDNQKGFSLIELIVAIAILTIVGGAVVGFCMSGTSSYKTVSTEVDLQYEAQLAVNQLSDLLIDANHGVGFDSANKTFFICNDSVAYTVVWNATDQKLTLNKYNVTASAVTFESSNLMAEYVTDFSATIPTEDNNNHQMVNLTIKFTKDDKEYLGAKNVTLRNKVSAYSSLAEAYPSKTIG